MGCDGGDNPIRKAHTWLLDGPLECKTVAARKPGGSILLGLRMPKWKSGSLACQLRRIIPNRTTWLIY
jgi:hypothetical protein